VISAAEGLRFRTLLEEEKYKYELFKLGYSPSSAHLEYETN